MYWTIAERNQLSVFPTGDLLLNRGLWFGVGLLVYGVGNRLFSFADRGQRRRGSVVVAQDRPDAPIATTPVAMRPVAQPNVSVNTAAVGANWWQLIRAQSWLDFRETIGSRVFLILCALSLLNLIALLLNRSSEGYGHASLPVTYDTVANGCCCLFGDLRCLWELGLLQHPGGQRTVDI